MSYKFEVEGGKTVKFPVGGKYCDRDIEVTAVTASVPLNTVYIGYAEPTADIGTDGDIYIVRSDTE